jgi:hypothetical protein
VAAHDIVVVAQVALEAQHIVVGALRAVAVAPRIVVMAQAVVAARHTVVEVQVVAVILQTDGKPR